MKAAAQKKSRPRKRTNKFRPWLLLFRLSAWLLVALVLWCGYLLWLINNHVNDNLAEADAGIVLGAAMWGNAPSPALRERLEYAYSLYEEGKVDFLILSGGHDANGAVKSEAEGMRDYLLAKGITSDKLLLEDKSHSTYENLRNSQAIANDHNYSSFIIITHDYHAARAASIAKHLKFADAQVAGTKSEVLNPVYNESREVLAFTKWKLDSILLLFGFRSPDPML
ncbi:YdcF family protein [Paenibacillus sp. YIM B09110]|uniref:YdcF family protein n=1 Tax=Paenibacillus sp. YIM B09110 TaxID=3126102 RepID=UPI00301E0CEE